MTMDKDILEVKNSLDAIRLKVNTLEQQIKIVSPVELIDFKATVITTLKSIDHDMDKASRNIDTVFKTYGELVGQINVTKEELLSKIVGLSSKCTRELADFKSDMSLELTSLKIKVSSFAVIAPIVISIIVGIVVKHLSG